MRTLPPSAAPLPLALVLAAVVLTLGACRSSPAADQDPEPSAQTQPFALPVEGTFWLLEEVADQAGALTALPSGVQATARFQDGTVSGSSGCNTFSAGYSLSGRSLEVGPAMSTLIGCEDPAASTETRVLAALDATATATTDAGRLRLGDADGAPLLVYRAAEPDALVGTPWSATSVNNGTGGVTSLIPGSTITAEFAQDGTVTGSSGCNTYRGEYAADGTSIQIGPLATTKQSCPEPLGVDEQEQQFLAAMQRATELQLEPSGLSLRADDGSLQVAFAPAG